MAAGANVNCPHCNGHLTETNEENRYQCRSCGRELNQCVVENLDTYQRLADSDTPAARLAKAALEGREADK